MIGNQPDTRRPARRPRSGEEGFSLIEVIMALSIFAIGLLAVAAMQTGAIQSNRISGGVTEGAVVAQDVMEQLLSIPFDDDDLDVNDPNDENDYHQLDAGKVPKGFTAVRWRVLDGADESGDPIEIPDPDEASGKSAMVNTKRVTVTVTAPGRESTLVCFRAELHR